MDAAMTTTQAGGTGGTAVAGGTAARDETGMQVEAALTGRLGGAVRWIKRPSPDTLYARIERGAVREATALLTMELRKASSSGIFRRPPAISSRASLKLRSTTCQPSTSLS